ncbi:hypothetical protein SAMD00023353_6100420 [Rosellinia necatrix]|uniref:Uncharacterized protein n=1 Tax=Rosellinia necatrix TaxID=77044 RepID=A0A1W2TTV8_ROSNE|nr:hypothetical protein SAMD00023353_6100420 [Rosellinia necatrix]
MPRVLPWKRREQETRSSPVQRVKQEDAEPARDESDSALNSDAANTPKNTLKRPRRASTSPPPAPPPEDSMIEGVDGDDRYRMVEDEFLATAQQFTAHLHAAEYKRLKAASELENAQTIRNISRPVVGQMTDIVKIKRERKILVDKQRLATRRLRKGGASDDESTGTDDRDDSWHKQSLHGLMESPGRRAKRFDALPSATSVTRAAAGFHRQTSGVVSPSRLRLKEPDNNHPHHTQGTEDVTGALDDSHKARRVPQPVSISFRAAEPKTLAVDRPQQRLEGLYKATETPRSRQPKDVGKAASDDDEDMDVIARLKKRREDRRRSRAQRKPASHEPAKANMDDILPDFL